MKKYLFFLLTIWIPMMGWSETPTHTLTIEAKARVVDLRVNSTKGTSPRQTVVQRDTTYIVTYPLNEGETYTININPNGDLDYEQDNIYSSFSAWMRDGSVFSTSRELTLTMGKSDIYLTAVMTRTMDQPYSPGANWFDASTGVLTLDEIRKGDIQKAYQIAGNRYHFAGSDIKQIVAIGSLKKEVGIYSDFGLFYSRYDGIKFDNLLSIDLSQTSGMTLLKGYNYNTGSFELPNLKHVILGASLDSINHYAFYLLNIDTIDCYAIAPPGCSSYAFYSMRVPKDQVLVRVPPESVELYKLASGWNEFPNIQPLYATSSITVSLPTDVPEGYYEDMTVELTNLRSQFVQNRKVLNKRLFVFGSQVPENEYQAILKNTYGQTMGQTEPMKLGEEDIKLTIDNLLRSKDVSLKVTTPDGKDVTGKVQVLWTDESDKAMGYASSLKAVAEGTRLTCKIILMNELAKQYVTPDARQYTVNGEGENLLKVQLLPIQQLMLHGQVKDKQTGENIADATVALTQQQGDDHQSVTATTDADGRFELQGTNESGELSVTAAGYLPQTVALGTPASDGALPSVEMELFNGVIVHTWFTYTEAAPEGTEGKFTDGYKAYSDAAYEVYNNTKGAAVKDFIIKENMLFFPLDVEPGDKLTVTVSGHNNTFSPVSDTCTISNSGLGHVTLHLVQKGALKATVNTTDSTSEMGVLYDADGRFVRSNSYRDGALSFTGLTAGDYSLISMTSNTLLRRALLLSTLDNMGLVEGTDYVKTPVHIEDGKIVSVNVPNVPALDMEKLHFTDSRTYFIANKNAVNVGTSYTIYSVSSKVFFAKKYAERIKNVEYVLDMPDEIDMVENSALIGSTISSYRMEEGHYIFPLEDMENNSLRLCLKTQEKGEFRVSGSVRFTLDGVQMIQPIGTVWLQNKGLTINTPVFVALSIRINGTAPLDMCGKAVEVYENDKLVGTPVVDARGFWSVNIQVPSTGYNEIHAIKARLTTPETGVIESEVKYILSKDRVIAERVVMLTPQNKPITFDYFKNTVSPKHYTYVLKGWRQRWEHVDLSYSTKFTFLAYFEDVDMSMVESVKIAVLASDGTTRTLDAKYDATKQCYYASSDYPNSLKTPISAYAFVVESEYSPISAEEQATLNEANAKVVQKVTQAAINAANKKGETEVLPDDDETLNLRYSISGKDPLAFIMKEMDYDEAVTYALENRPLFYRSDTCNIVYTFVNGMDEAEMIIINVDEHFALRTVLSYAEMDNSSVNSNSRFAPKPIPTPEYAFAKGFGWGSNAIALFGLDSYFNAPGQQMEMAAKSSRFSRIMQRKVDFVQREMYETCVYGEVGKSKLSKEQKDYYNKKLDDLIDRSNAYLDKLDNLQNAFIEDLFRKAGFDISTTILGAGLGKAAAIEAANKLGPKAWPTINKIEDFLASETGEFLTAESGFLTDVLKQGPGELPSLDELLSLDFDRHYKEFTSSLETMEKELVNEFDDLLQDIRDNQDGCEKECEKEEGEDCDEDDDDDDDEPECEGEDCDEDEEDDDDNDEDEDDDDDAFSYPHKDFPEQVSPLIDPSGYVYEAVPSNRIEGATATVYYRDYMLNQNGNSTGESDIMWDAENYDQKNPQITDATGMFQWDVPQGLWQVRVQKEGYENNASDWLPVPPPQLDVNIPLVRNKLPKVEKAHAYEDAVAVKFDTYMIPALLTTDLITVTQNGNAVEGTIELTDEEEAPDGAAYASRLRFIPSTPFTANEVTLFISGQVQNYSGIEMDEPFEAVLPIEREVKNLVADKKAKVAYGSTGSIHVKAEPAAAAAGKTVLVQCASGIIASAVQTSVVLNEKGEADVTIQGDLPGNEIVTFTMQEAELTASTLVKVVMRSNEFPVEAPEASVPSETEVEKGTEITLSCKTEGAAIYYTLDGSSPVDSGTRILYDGKPIVINEETTLTVVAVVEGIGMSEVRIYHYTVHNNQKIEVVNSNRHAGNVQKYIVNGQLIILRDGKTFTVLGAEVK